MFDFQKTFGRRSGGVRNSLRKRGRTRLNLEALEDRRVLTAVLPAGIASTLAPSASVSSTTSQHAGHSGLVTPTLTAATVESSTEVDLTWTTAGGATSYTVIDSSGGGPWKTLPPVTVPRDAVRNLKPGTTYSFAVKAENSTMSSHWSNTLTLSAAPTVTAKAVSSTQINLSWNAVLGATGYGIVGEEINGTWRLIGDQQGNGNDSYQATGLVPGGTYTFEVSALNSHLAPFGPAGTATAMTLPAAPMVTAKAVSGNEIDLTWPAVYGADFYDVLENNSTFLISLPVTGNPSYQATALVPYTTYSFHVIAHDASGLGPAGTASATTLAEALTTLTVHPSQTTITAGSPLGVTVTAKDQFGKPCNNVSVEVTITNKSLPPNENEESPPNVVSIVDGTGTVWFTPENSGTVLIAASYGSIDSPSVPVVVDAVTQTSSFYWSGYAATPGSGVTEVGASWVQPAVSGSNGAKVSEWVGIDGDTNGTVEQCGVAATMVNGSAQYTAWYEFWGDQSGNNKGRDYFPQNIPKFPVHAGDLINAAVELVPGTTRTFDFIMQDLPAGGGTDLYSIEQKTMEYVTPNLANADWIVENPNSAGQPLANFGTLNFEDAWAQVNFAFVSINQLQNAAAITLTNFAGVDEAIPSNPPVCDDPLVEDGSNFSVTYHDPTLTAVPVGGRDTTGSPVVATRTAAAIASQPTTAPAGDSPEAVNILRVLDAALAAGDDWVGPAGHRHRKG